jgi:hypothetical protein
MPAVSSKPTPKPTFTPEMYAAFAEYTERDLKKALADAHAAEERPEEMETCLTAVLKLTAQRNALAAYLKSIAQAAGTEAPARRRRSDYGRKRGQPKDGSATTTLFGTGSSPASDQPIVEESERASECRRLQELVAQLTLTPKKRDELIEEWSKGKFDNISAVLTGGDLSEVKAVYQLLVGHVRG